MAFSIREAQSDNDVALTSELRVVPMLWERDFKLSMGSLALSMRPLTPEEMQRSAKIHCQFHLACDPET